MDNIKEESCLSNQAGIVQIKEKNKYISYWA